MQCVGYDTGFFENHLLYAPPKQEVVHKDVRDMDEKDLEGVDALVHLAAISNDPLKRLDAVHIYEPTRSYSMRLAELCKKKGIRLIFASSCSVYGRGGDVFLDETSPTHPQTPYSLNKLQIEEDLRSLSDRNFSPIALRFATVFGPSPRMRFDLVMNMFAAMATTSHAIVLNSDGTPWRPNLHILDACEAVRRAIELDSRGGELLVLNVGDEANNFQVIQMAETVRAIVPGCEIKFLFKNSELDKEGLIEDRKVKSGVDTRTYKVSFAKIREVLPGFRAGRSLGDGARELVVLFRKLPLTPAMFKQRGFYRLQELEHLHENGYLSDDLRWQKDRPSLPMTGRPPES
jgi:nucleoside-diphosphate-sugar epimerase